MTPQPVHPTNHTQSSFMPSSSVGEQTYATPADASQPERSYQSRRQATPEPEKPKDPIPAEHQVIQDVFDGLRNRCLTAASHPVRII